jgi:hypothetical protein
MICHEGGELQGVWAAFALRKAALMIHTIPDLGIKIRQPGCPTIRVATWLQDHPSHDIEVSPCEFRRLILKGMIASSVGLSGLFKFNVRPILIDWFTGPKSEIGIHGMVRHFLPDGDEMFAFPTLLSLGDISHSIDSDGTSIRGAHGVKIDCITDDDLGCTILSTQFAGDNELLRTQAIDAICRICATFASEEAAFHLTDLIERT